MKRLSVVGAICVSFLLGAAMSVVAQDEKQEEHKNDRQNTAQPPARQQEARPEERRNQEPQKEERRQEPRQDERQMKQQEEQQKKVEKRQEKMDKQQGRDQERREQTPAQQQTTQGKKQARDGRNGGNQRRISEPDFRAHFGRQHRFAPGRMQVYNGQPQFYYGGYNFVLVEAWPVDWAYDADDYYIDEFDGEYWLFNVEQPGVRLAIFIAD
jgi:TolA-binding protein